jgi:preprotein translocase subunit SecD
LGVTLVLIVLVALLAIYGTPIPNTKYNIMPVSKAIKLGLDLRGGVYAVYQGDANAENFASGMTNAVEVMRRRLSGQGYNEASVTMQGSDCIRVEIPDVHDPDAIMDILGKPARLTFVGPDGAVIMEGKNIVEAFPSYDQNNTPVVSFELDSEGTAAFRDATAKFTNQIISIRLDDDSISEPTVQSVISDGRGIITGMGSIDEARTLANLILSGSLSVELTISEMNAISATLGEEAIGNSVIAGIVGIILVMLFMLILYRLPGLIANMALCIYILIVFYAVALIGGIQLTLPGIAGILLGVGMAVDANVIIFERFREELKQGRPLDSAVDRGFKNALRAIIDSNVTTIIAGLVLMNYGTGPIKGFAITLVIGILVSMFTAIIVTRFLLKQVVRINRTNISLYSR